MNLIVDVDVMRCDLDGIALYKYHVCMYVYVVRERVGANYFIWLRLILILLSVCT